MIEMFNVTGCLTNYSGANPCEHKRAVLVAITGCVTNYSGANPGIENYFLYRVAAYLVYPDSIKRIEFMRFLFEKRILFYVKICKS
jgi:hypothetical protein